MPAAIPIEVTASQQRKLKGIVKAKTSSQRDVFRARIILGLAQGLSHDAIAKEQSVSLLALEVGGSAGRPRALRVSKTPLGGDASHGFRPGLSEGP